MKRNPLRIFNALILTACFSPHTYSLPVIQEVFYDQIGGDGTEVFTEIYGQPGFDLSGWKLQGINGANNSIYRSISLNNAVIPADGLLLISTTKANSVLALASDFTANVDWQNGADSLLLINASDVVIDALQYGLTSFASRGEGQPAEDIDPGLSLSRRYAGFDNGDNYTDFVARNPTPGTVTEAKAIPLISVPAPTSWLFIMGGSVFLMGSHHSRIRAKQSSDKLQQ